MSEGTWDDPAVVYGRGSCGQYVKGLGVATGGSAVTPSDTQDLAFVARSLYVGGMGDVKVKTANGDEITFASVPGGTWLPVAVTRVYATGTSATGLVAVK
jgi:hypothetical protein